MPKSETTVRNKIIAYFNEKQIEMKKQINKEVSMGKKFCVTTEEWANILLKRYLNVTLHCQGGEVLKLGLIQITGTCNTDKVETLVEAKLGEFCLNLKQIGACTNDGAAVMQKYGRNIDCEIQLCLNRAIHVAVCDTFYQKNMNNDKENEAESCSHEFNESDDDDNDVTEESSSNIIGCIFEENTEYNLKSDIKRVLQQTRKIILHFKRSPKKTELLALYAKEKLNTELTFKLDVKTRWNSLVPTIERFILLKDCIKQCLVDTNLWH